MTVPWLDDFRAMLAAEFTGAPIIATLATVDAHSHPDARSIVIRETDPDGVIWITSDARSAKHEQLRHNDSAAIVVYLPQRRAQFRFRGLCVLAPADEEPSTCLEFWTLLSPQARALFFSPAPGTPLIDAASAAVASTDHMPDHFEVIAFQPHQAEFLDLNTTPHTRVRYVEQPGDGWSTQLINP